MTAMKKSGKGLRNYNKTLKKRDLMIRRINNFSQYVKDKKFFDLLFP